MSLNVRYEFPKRGSIAGMRNMPEMSGNSVTEQRIKTREQYDQSIFGK